MSINSKNGPSGFSLQTAKDHMQDLFGGSTQGNQGGFGGILPGLLGAGAIGGLAGALLSGKSMKKAAGTLLTVGGGVAAGALAWNLYQKWAGGKAAPAQGNSETAYPAAQTDSSRTPAATEPDTMLFLQALVYAAKADGHIDDQERERINALMERMHPGRNMTAVIEPLLNSPIQPEALAARVRNRQEAEAVYKLSYFVLDVDHFMEKAYLDTLAQNLGIDAPAREELEKEADAARREMESAT